MTLRQDKVKEQIKHMAANFISEVGNKTSLITVTNCDITPDLKQATIFFTVLPVEKELDTLNFLKRQRSEMRDYVKERMKTHTIPFMEVEIDKGEKHRQKIDELLRQ